MASPIAVLDEKIKAFEDERETLVKQADEAGSFTEVKARLEEIDGELPALVEDRNRFATERERKRTQPAVATEKGGSVAPVVEPVGLTKSLSAQFLGSEDWQNYLSHAAPNGKFPAKAEIRGPVIPIEGSLVPALMGRPLQRMGLITSGATSASELIMPDQSGIFDPGALQRELTLLDLITRSTTNSDSVDYVRVTGFTNNAAAVAEADNVLDSDDTGRKPWSALALSRVNAVVQTIAHGEAATSRALADAGQMRTLLDGFLRYGLAEELEDQIVNGAGSGNDFEGIIDQATGTQAFDTDYLTTIRKAKTTVRTGGKSPANGILINPEDWEALDLELTLGGAASNRQAAEESAARVWGLRVVESEAIAAGTAIVADFSKCILWDRQQTTITATSGYMDFFMKNLVAVLAEMRAAFAVIRPAAFVVVSFGS